MGLVYRSYRWLRRVLGLREVEWAEIEQRHIGRLVPLHIIDHTPVLLQLAVHGIPAQVIERQIRLAL
jgi:hypothetical protein